MKINAFISIGLILSTMTLLWGQSHNPTSAELPDEVKIWEQTAEKGDTAALHKLLLFLDNNVPVYPEVVEVVEPEDDNNDWIAAEDSVDINDDEVCDTVAPPVDAETEALYYARLEYWLAKGLAMNDPVAIYIKGMRLYYIDEAQSLQYLSKSAESGNAQAALFCGSACFNQSRYDEAIKYLTIAYEKGAPSAGWHLAMCLAQKGSEKDIEQAIGYLRHSAEMDYPEAVLEMRRIEPANPVWQQKVDSLEISFHDFPIIQTE